MRMRQRGDILIGTPSKRQIKRGVVPFAVYDTALTDFAYGNYSRMSNSRRSGGLGDLFGDIMGAVVGKENWDARPDWMKKIAVKPDPAKLFQAASKVVSPKKIGQIVGQANQSGFNMFYQTPAGQLPVTPELAEGVYGNYPTYLSAKEAFSSVPIWVYALGAGGILFAFMMRK